MSEGKAKDYSGSEPDEPTPTPEPAAPLDGKASNPPSPLPREEFTDSHPYEKSPFEDSFQEDSMPRHSVLKSLEGEVLDEKYELLRLIGHGGMGAVFEARHLLIGSSSAVKILHAAVARSEKVIRRFRKEARIAGALGHANVVKVTDMGGLDSDRPYIVMEFLEGRSLREHLDAMGPLPISEAIDIVSQLLRGLGAVHGAGVIHRDLKPDNIFLVESDGSSQAVAKILDFGISKILGPDIDQATLTRTGAVVGTPYYMSPEQAMGKKELDHRTDIYSTGAILYQMLAGRRPFLADNYNALIAAILMQAPTPLRSLRQDIPDGLEEIVLKALSRNPEDRFDTALDLLAALENLPSEEGITAAAQAPENDGELSDHPDPIQPPTKSKAVGGQEGQRSSVVWFSFVIGIAGIAGVTLALNLCGDDVSRAVENEPSTSASSITAVDADATVTIVDADFDALEAGELDVMVVGGDTDTESSDSDDDAVRPATAGGQRRNREKRPSIRRDVPF